ncbi:unnamed protein product [Cuscuta epithymum]|uniref:Uncharacterized protein n=1 Tax=Cuscuta epithymum TaxID=186058 RepID=A0AAV0CX34_9ASTE|nr:unnamed protein product [Cuscuta epithymum]
MFRSPIHSPYTPFEPQRYKRAKRIHTTQERRKEESSPQVRSSVRSADCLSDNLRLTRPIKAYKIPKEISQDEESVMVWFASIRVVEDFQIVRAKHNLAGTDLLS